MIHRQTRQFVAVFAHLDSLRAAVRAAQDRGLEIQDLYSPVPVPDLIDRLSPKRSPVRFFTFAGATAGLLGGLALAILTSLVWNLIVFGKPVTHVVPFLVIGFEGTILLGAIATLVALLVLGRLPTLGGLARTYRPDFSKDRFGLVLACGQEQAEVAKYLLRQAGAQDVQMID